MFGDEITCVYWDFQTNKWSSNGCNIVSEDSNRDITVCECNHLTNFAALLDISGRENESLAKSILTYVFCGLSIICLILTILITSMKRAQNTVYNLSTNELIKTRNIITYNLCVCLIISDLLILFGMDRTEHKV
jgi:latrophilin 2